MPTLRIIWDVLFRGEFVTQKRIDIKVAKAMDTQCSDYKIEAVLRWNTVLEGQKVARIGSTWRPKNGPPGRLKTRSPGCLKTETSRGRQLALGRAR